MPAFPRTTAKKLRPLQLAAIIFLTVSGGPYGLEPLFSYVGNHGALVLFLVQLTRHNTPFSIPTPSLHGLGFSPIAMGLYTVMWNFIGWDNATTYAGEVRRPARSYLFSISLAFATIVLVYIVATLAV